MQRHAVAGNQSVLRYLQRHLNEEEHKLERMVQRAPSTTALKAKFQQPAEVVNARRAPLMADAITKVKDAMSGLCAVIDKETLEAASPARQAVIAANQKVISDAGAEASKKSTAAAFNKKYLAATAQLPGLAVPRATLQGQVDALGPASTIAQVRAVAAAVNTFAETVKQVVISRASASGVQVTVGAAEPLLAKAEAITGDVIGQFGSNMRESIGDTLGALPASHVAGNASFSGIEDATANPDPNLGAASFYSYDSGKLSIVRPDSPLMGKMSEFTYTSLSRGVGWQLNMMDAGAMAGYDGIAGNEDLALGKRKVMGGISSAAQPHINALAHGKLVDWTLRHETGHSVDQQIKFTDKRAKIPAFGGWRQHVGADIARVMLGKAAGISGPSVATLRPLMTAVFDMDHGDLVSELKRIEGLLERPPTGADPDPLASWARSASKTDREALKPALRWARIATAVPWTTADGQASILAVEGRVYQLDHYGTWVSYLAGARANAVSSYQFSTPGEWFAEAYAAFYDPEKKSAGALNDATRSWFLQNLGAPRKTGTEADGALAQNGVLGTLADLDEDVDPDALGLSLASELPADLKSGGGLTPGFGAGVSGMAAVQSPGRNRANAVSH